MKTSLREIGFLAGVIMIVLLVGLSFLRFLLHPKVNNGGSYHELAADVSKEDPLKYIHEDFTVADGFHTNLPIVLIDVDKEIPDYKEFHNNEEVVLKDVNPYVYGEMIVYDAKDGDNALKDLMKLRGKTGATEQDKKKGFYRNPIKIKKRGHTSMYFDKAQYLVKTTDIHGMELDTDYLSMGKGHEWILNGSMADKSMIRNYLAYRIAAEIGGNNMSPDSSFCEVLFANDDGSLSYQGVFLLMETISRGSERINIDATKDNEDYTSYIVRRDRFTTYDPMLNTFARENGIDEQWIGVKYPGAGRLKPAWIDYITNDFSQTEKIIYSDDPEIFDVYDKYIDVDSFVDYFLINEFFGNYDAGEHSTYMYKNSGDKLYIGPVWDFDQAMNNYFAEEMDASVLSFQTRPLYKKLTDDRRFLDELKTRYHVLVNGSLSLSHINATIDETVAYLRSARAREWYRWEADYVENAKGARNYQLNGYRVDGKWISRFNTNYDAEIYNIKTYLNNHSKVIETELTGIREDTHYNTHLTVHNAVFFFIVLCLFFVPSIIINRKA